MDFAFDPNAQFFALIGTLQALFPEAAPVGSTASPAGEAIRFRANPTFGFPSEEVASVEFVGEPASRAEVRMNLIGLYGPASPLPTIFTERALDPDRGGVITDFLDCFNHRFASLLYLIWKQYRHDLRYQDDAADPISLAAGSLFGLLPLTDPASGQERVTMLPYTGLLAMQSRSAKSVARILGHLLDVPCRIEEFVPRWIDIPPEAQFRLGAPLELGADTLLGERLQDVMGQCHIWFGPMTFERYCAFLPDATGHAAIQHAIDFVMNEPLARALGLILEDGEASDWVLGERKLGWTSWIDPPRSEPVETLI